MHLARVSYRCARTTTTRSAAVPFVPDTFVTPRDEMMLFHCIPLLDQSFLSGLSWCVKQCDRRGAAFHSSRFNSIRTLADLT